MLSELENLLSALSGDDKKSIVEMTNQANKDHYFIPNVGPQTDAYFSEADILLYGGFPGSGKSALLNGLALNEHHNSLIVRRQFSDLEGIVRDCRDIARNKNPTLKGFVGGGRPKYRKPEGGEIVFEGVEVNGQIDTGKQGNARDFIGVDEGAQLPLDAIMMLFGWNRSTREGQRCRLVIASNPPVNSVGDWMPEFFAPWLDPDYINPAKFGELRYFYIDSDSKSIEVESKEPFYIDGDKIFPHSRTFIPGKLEDNPYLKENYKAKIQALPEPARTILLEGNFLALREDQKNQVMPTDWVKAAMARREQHPYPPDGIPLCAMGVDIAAGGKDNTVIAKRYDWWYDDIIEKPGIETPLGRDVAAMIISHYKDKCEITLDMSGGFGSGVWEVLTEVIQDRGSIHAFKGAETKNVIYRTKDGHYTFFNARSAAYWRFREALDPSQPGGSPVCLPDDKKLLSQLTAPRFEITARGIQITPKEKVIAELKVSPDRADALVMSYYFGQKGLTGHVNHKPLRKNSNNIKVNLGFKNRKKR